MSHYAIPKGKNMKKRILQLLLILCFISYEQNKLYASSNTQLKISVTVVEHCEVIFNNRSADYFEKCNSIDGIEHMNAKNIIGEMSAVDSENDPYFLDRIDATQETINKSISPLPKKKIKVVTIVY